MTRPKGNRAGQAAKSALDFLEEVVWGLSSVGPASLKQGIDELRKLAMESESLKQLSRSSSTKLGSSQFLIGVLPQLLADEELFSSNQSISKFADEVFGIQITRWEKRSRYEMIGMLVMEVRMLPEAVQSDLMRILERLVLGGSEMKRLKRDSGQTGFSWNETIRKLSEV